MCEQKHTETVVPTYKDVNYFITVVWNDKGDEKYRPDGIVAQITHSAAPNAEDNGVVKTSYQNSGSVSPKTLAYRGVDVSSLITLLSETDETPSATNTSQDVRITPAMNWHYEWTARDDGSVWNVIGEKVKHYTLTTKTVDHGWILEYQIIMPPAPDPVIPGTGEEFPWLPVVLLSVSGVVLVIFGIISRRKAHDK